MVPVMHTDTPRMLRKDVKHSIGKCCEIIANSVAMHLFFYLHTLFRYCVSTNTNYTHTFTQRVVIAVKV